MPKNIDPIRKGVKINQFLVSTNKTIAEVRHIVENTVEVFERDSQKFATADISPAGNVGEMAIRLTQANLKAIFSILFLGSYPIISFYFGITINIQASFFL